MKRLIPTALIAFTLLTSTSAFANDVNLDVNIGGGGPPSGSIVIGQPPVVVAPQPVIVAPPQTVIVEHPGNYDPHHSDRDRKYWEARKEEERKEQERREHERHEHADQHDDHNGHDEHHDHD